MAKEIEHVYIEDIGEYIPTSNVRVLKRKSGKFLEDNTIEFIYQKKVYTSIQYYFWED